RDHGLSRHLDTLSADIVFQPVIATREVIAGHFTPRERRRAMAAAVFQRGGLAAAVAEQHHLLVEKGSPDRARLQIIRPDRGVPAVAQEHKRPPTVTSNKACRASFDARRNVRADLRRLSTAAARSWSPAFFPGRRECK